MIKTIKFFAIILLIFVSCKKNTATNINKQEVKKINTNYVSFGEKISTENTISSNEMFTKFSTLQMGDTLNVKFASKINDICTKKGCWMKLPVGNQETMVRFKDYGFFMPLDAKDKEVIEEGKAFVQVTSVKELKHYAFDAGKSKEEIASIRVPKKEFTFEANGVLMKK